MATFNFDALDASAPSASSPPPSPPLGESLNFSNFAESPPGSFDTFVTGGGRGRGI